MSYGGHPYGGAPYGGQTGSSGASFSLSPNASHATGTIHVVVTGSGTNWGVSNPFSIQGSPSPASNLRNYVNNSATSAEFDITQDAISSEPVVIADSDSGTTQSFSCAAVAPGQPTIGTATENGSHNGTVSVTFTPNADNGGSAVTLATATGSLGDSGTSGGTSPIVVTIAAANKGQSQTWVVTQTNAAGTSSGSAASNAVAATTVPGAPTGPLLVAINGRVVGTCTAPTDTGGESIDEYTITLSTGQTETGALPLYVTCPNSVAVTATFTATNAVGTSAASAASNSATPGGFAQYTGCVRSDGTGSLSVPALDATKAFPFWVRGELRTASELVHGNGYGVWSSGRSTGTLSGTGMAIYQRAPNIAVITNLGTSAFSQAFSDQANLTYPYTDIFVCEFISDTEHKLWINGVLEATNNTSRTIDLSAGTPLTTLFMRSDGAQKLPGSMANFVVGTGVLDAIGHLIANTFGADYSQIPGVTNWYPLDINGRDVLGSPSGPTFTAAGGISYLTDTLGDIPTPDVATVLRKVLNQETWPTGTVGTPTAGSPPVTVTTNLANAKRIDWSFSHNMGAYNGRSWLYTCTAPVIPGRHLVVVNGGHEIASEAAFYGMDKLVRTLVQEGYDVLQDFAPGCDALNPDYAGPGGASTLHAVTYLAAYSTGSPYVNPIERFLVPRYLVLQSIYTGYTKRSVAGLSGGGSLAVWTAALMPDFINHGCMSFRSITPARRARFHNHFEGWSEYIGWHEDVFVELAAQTNRRVVLDVGENDESVSAKTMVPDGQGAYLDIDTASAIYDPIRSRWTAADISMYEELGAVHHEITQDAIDNALLPMLEADLNPLGEVAFTEQDDSASAAGTVPISGVVSVSEQSDDVAAASAATGAAVSVSEQDDSVAAGSLHSVTGDVTLSEQTDSGASTAAVAICGVFNDLATFGGDKHSEIVISGHRITHPTGSVMTSARATVGRSSGSVYFEMTAGTDTVRSVGIGTAAAGLTSFVGSDAASYGFFTGYDDGETCLKFNNGAFDEYGCDSGSGSLGEIRTGDVIGVHYDADAQALTFYVNGVSQGVAYSGIPAGTYYPMASMVVGASVIFNFGDSAFSFTQPAGSGVWERAWSEHDDALSASATVAVATSVSLVESEDAVSTNYAVELAGSVAILEAADSVDAMASAPNLGVDASISLYEADDTIGSGAGIGVLCDVGIQEDDDGIAAAGYHDLSSSMSIIEQGDIVVSFGHLPVDAPGTVNVSLGSRGRIITSLGPRRS